MLFLSKKKTMIINPANIPVLINIPEIVFNSLVNLAARKIMPARAM
jgi:hypothetical protein